jgi:hypothetical protein
MAVHWRVGVGCLVGGCQLISGLGDFAPATSPASATSSGAGGGTSAAGAGGAGGGQCTPVCAPQGNNDCDSFPICNCLPGQNCIPTADLTKLTCYDAGPKGLHDQCGSSGACAKGHVCANNVCIQYCDCDSDCTPVSSAAVCRSGGVLGFGFCAANCDPLDPKAQCNGNGCDFIDLVTTVCKGAGSGMGAGTCVGANKLNCAPGYKCILNKDCMKFCRVTHALEDCPPGKDCVKFNEPFVHKGETYGVCAL